MIEGLPLRTVGDLTLNEFIIIPPEIPSYLPQRIALQYYCTSVPKRSTRAAQFQHVHWQYVGNLNLVHRTHSQRNKASTIEGFMHRYISFSVSERRSRSPLASPPSSQDSSGPVSRSFTGVVPRSWKPKSKQLSLFGGLMLEYTPHYMQLVH